MRWVKAADDIVEFEELELGDRFYIVNGVILEKISRNVAVYMEHYRKGLLGTRAIFHLDTRVHKL
jgi:hypothetical protein